MARLLWDQTGQHLYETGVDRGVLYIPNGSGLYTNGVAWNGLTGVTESPSGAEANAQYADNIKYLNLYSAEEFGATIEAFTYPDEFAQFDGLATPQVGVQIGQQSRKTFGLSYRTLLGNEVAGEGYGYKLHLIYGATASPSEKAYSTVNDSPEALSFSWDLATVPVPVTGLKPTALVVIDSTKVNSTNLATLEDALYGTAGTAPRLPLPDEVSAMFSGAVTVLTPQAIAAAAPTFNATTGVTTITALTGVTWINAVTGATLAAGVTSGVNIPASGGSIVVRALPASGLYAFSPLAQTSWTFNRT